jgi:hypothetical protein
MFSGVRLSVANGVTVLPMVAWVQSSILPFMPDPPLIYLKHAPSWGNRPETPVPIGFGPF